MNLPPLPHLPFTRPHFDEAAIDAVAEVLRSGWVTNGPKIAAFEAALSAYFGRPTLCFANGTCTMEVALRLANVGPGDEVITTPISWVATANVILQVGARPVFADIDPHTRNIDPREIAKHITSRTKAVISVHMAGVPCDLAALYALAERDGLTVIEDAAQAIGAIYQGQRIGSFGHYASFSFQANKNLTTVEGGCLVLPSADIASRAEALRLQGVVRSGVDQVDVEEYSGKYNMTDLAAVLGLQQLPTLDATTAHRRALYAHYHALFDAPALKALGVGLPQSAPEGGNAHMFQLVLNPPQTPNRAAFITAMKAQGISVGVHYPAMHLFALYRSMGHKPGDCPHAEHIGKNIVTLPLFNTLSLEDVARVVEAVQRILLKAPA